MDMIMPSGLKMTHYFAACLVFMSCTSTAIAGEDAASAGSRPVPVPPLAQVPAQQDAGDAVQIPAIPFDPDLAAAFATALDRNPAVTSAKTEAQAAGVDIRAAKWQRAPTVSVQSNYYGVQGDEPARFGPTLTVDLPLVDFGHVQAGISRAIANQRGASASFDQARRDVMLQVAAQFFECKRLSERIRIIDRNLAALEGMQESMHRRVEQELSPQSDLQLARTRTLQVRIIRDSTLAQREAALRRLQEQLVDPEYSVSDTPIVGSLGLNGAMDDIQGIAEGQDPQRKRLLAEAQVAAADARASRSASIPSLNLEYDYDQIYHHRVGVALKAQATGLSQIVAAKAAGLRETAASQKVDTAVHDLRAEIAADFIDYKSALARSGVATESSLSNDEVRDSYLRQFTAGKRTWLDVMNAVREAMTAQLDVVDIHYEALLMQTRLLIRMGVVPDETKRQN
jgi:adhesin transport system outer membrane protein